MEDLNVVQEVVNFITKWWPVLTSFIGSFAILATVTANKSDDKIVNQILKLINLFGANFGKAKNDPNES